jgi:hypothetical protein
LTSFVTDEGHFCQKLNDMKKIISVFVLGLLFTSCFDPKKGELDVDITTFKGPVKFENLCSDVDLKVVFTFSQMPDTFTVLV